MTLRLGHPHARLPGGRGGGQRTTRTPFDLQAVHRPGPRTRSQHLETPMLSTLLEKTDPARRRVGTAIVVGVIGGFFSAIVKFGWEVPFPPRTPERNATNPPQQLLEQLGMSPEQSHTGVTFNGNEGLPIYSFIIHFSFAIVFAVFYCVMAEYYRSITLWQGGRLRSARVGGGAPGAHAADGHGSLALPVGRRRADLGGALLRGAGARHLAVVDRARAPGRAQPHHPPARPVGSARRRTGPLSPQGSARLS